MVTTAGDEVQVAQAIAPFKADAMKSWLELGTTKGFAVGLAAGGFPGALAGAVEGAQGGAVGGAAAAIGCDLAGVYGGFILP